MSGWAVSGLVICLCAAPTVSQQLPLRPRLLPPIFIPAADRLPDINPPSERAAASYQAAAPLAVVGNAWRADGPHPILGAQVENAAPNSASIGAIKAVRAPPTHPHII